MENKLTWQTKINYSNIHQEIVDETNVLELTLEQIKKKLEMIFLNYYPNVKAKLTEEGVFVEEEKIDYFSYTHKISGENLDLIEIDNFINEIIKNFRKKYTQIIY
jgi:hypothetical protein